MGESTHAIHPMVLQIKEQLTKELDRKRKPYFVIVYSKYANELLDHLSYCSSQFKPDLVCLSFEYKGKHVITACNDNQEDIVFFAIPKEWTNPAQPFIDDVLQRLKGLI